MIIYDPSTDYLITISQNKITSIHKEKVFKYDDLFVPVSEEQRTELGLIGTAFLSGYVGYHLSEYNGLKAIVKIGKPIHDIANYYSQSNTSLNLSSFLKENMISFYSKEVDLMPCLGYVYTKYDLSPVSFTYYENQNIYKNALVKSEDTIEVLPYLEGDAIGQMAQLLLSGNIVDNLIYSSTLDNPFYGKTLSLLPLNGVKESLPILLLTKSSFCKYFPNHLPVVADLVQYVPVPIELDENQEKFFGFKSLKVYAGTAPKDLSAFWGFISYFSSGLVDYLYVYDKADRTKLQCYHNLIVKS